MNDFISYSELYHYGIKGMHWGIRRYQNPDGTLTKEGRKHYNIEKDEEIDAINRHYESKNKAADKRISKAKDYLSRDKSERTDKKTNKAKSIIEYNKQLKKTYSELANAEIKKIKNTDIKELSKELNTKRGKVLASTLIATGAINLVTVPTFGAAIIPLGVAVDRNFLTNEQRQTIIDKNMKSVTSNQYHRNSIQNDTFRYYNRKPKKKK